MSTLAGENEDLSFIEQIDKAIQFFSAELDQAILDENQAGARDHSNHIVRLKKERDAILEKSKKLISLAEAKKRISEVTEPLVQAIEEIVPDHAPAIYKRQAEIYFENEQPFDG